MSTVDTDIFRCPHCAPGGKGALTSIRDNWLGCSDCGRKYPIVQEIPVLLPEEGTKWQSVGIEKLPDIEEHDRFVNAD